MRTTFTPTLAVIVSVVFISAGCSNEDPPGYGTGDGGVNHWEPNMSCPGPCLTELDRGELGPDGILDEVTNIAYEGDYPSSNEFDGNNDGVVDIRKTFTYDGSGNVLTESVDGVEWTIQTPQHGADGAVDIRYTYEYDGDSNMTKLEQDGHGPSSVANGVPNRTVEFAYESGQLVRTEEDANGDDTVDIITEYTRDEYGNPVTITFDGSYYEEADGTVDRTDVYNYTYDGEGRVLIDELDKNWVDGEEETIDRRIVYSYTASGMIATLSEVWYFENYSLYEENEYDGADRLTMHKYCYDYCSTETFTYDSHGNMSKMEFTNENYDVEVLARTSFWYDCWQ